LNIHSGIARPRGSKNAVATTALTWRPKVMFTDLFQITKANSFRVRFHLVDDFRSAYHAQIVPLLILFSRATLHISRIFLEHGPRVFLMPLLRIRCFLRPLEPAIFKRFPNLALFIR